jgi:hypothetical protein
MYCGILAERRTLAASDAFSIGLYNETTKAV